MQDTISQEDLIECRKRFGEPGSRRISFPDRICYLNIRKPFWCNTEDDLWHLFKNKWKVIKNGNIVWGHIVQANVLLFKPGTNDCPASVLFSPDPKEVINLSALNYASGCMFNLKNTTPGDEELLQIANTLTDEMSRTFGVKVPQKFCQGFNFYEASTFISRKHLPNGVLSGSVFPLLVSSRSPYYCFPLPSKYWSKNIVDYWFIRG